MGSDAIVLYLDFDVDYTLYTSKPKELYTYTHTHTPNYVFRLEVKIGLSDCLLEISLHDQLNFHNLFFLGSSFPFFHLSVPEP